MFSVERQLLFTAPKPSYEHSSEKLIWVPRREEQYRNTKCLEKDVIPCMFFENPEDTHTVLVYLHGNGADLGLCRNSCLKLQKLMKVHVLSIEYIGYGLCDGDPNEESVSEGVHDVFRWLTHQHGGNWPSEQIVLFGRSLGCGIGFNLLQTFSCSLFVCFAPFTSFRHVVNASAGSFGFVSNFFTQRFDNISKIKNITTPFLFLHSRDDEMIGIDHSRRLLAECKRTKLKCHLDELEGLNHNQTNHKLVAKLILKRMTFGPVLRWTPSPVIYKLPVLSERRRNNNEDWTMFSMSGKISAQTQSCVQDDAFDDAATSDGVSGSRLVRTGIFPSISLEYGREAYI